MIDIIDSYLITDKDNPKPGIMMSYAYTTVVHKPSNI